MLSKERLTKRKHTIFIWIYMHIGSKKKKKEVWTLGNDKIEEIKEQILLNYDRKKMVLVRTSLDQNT